MVRSIFAAIVALSIAFAGMSTGMTQAAGPRATPYVLGTHVQHFSLPCARDASKTCPATLTVTVSSDKPASAHQGFAIQPSGCTGCGWFYFGCPGYYHLHTQWDQQDLTHFPLYHVAWDTYDQTNCSSAWTVYQALPVCQTFDYPWQCEGGPVKGVSWDGSYHHDYLYQKLKEPFGPYCYEEDTVFLQNSLSPSGWVNGYGQLWTSTC